MSTSDTTNALYTVNKGLAYALTTGRAASVEGSPVVPRGSIYGEPYVQSVMGARTVALGDEGSQWVITNTPQTAILDTAALTAFAATTPTMVLFNNNPTGGRSIYIQRMHFTVAAAGASGTNWLWQWLVDTGNRYSSGGSALTPTNPNLGVLAAATGAVCHFGAITATAANASRIVGAGVGRTVIKVVGDEYTWEFGGSVALSGAGMPTDGTLQLTKTWPVVGFPLAPQNSLLFYEYAASQATAAQFDNIVIEYIER
jgi:hypothetical protein